MALRFVSVTEAHLQYVGGVSAKEYRVKLDPATLTVTTSWGRIGNVVNSQVFACTSLEAARELAVAKVEEKRRKGYGITQQFSATATAR